MIALKDEVVRLRLASSEQLKGCSEREIELVENLAGGTLPAIYRTFLADMGKGAGYFLQGFDCFFADIPRLRSYADELLRDTGKSVPQDAFVFLSSQGVWFLYFLRGTGNDPKVFRIGEREPGPVLHAASLTDFYRDELNQTAEAIHKGS